MKTNNIFFLLVLALITISGCSTKISSFPILNDTPRKGGVPYFIPKAMLQIKEPIEVSRIESLFAIIDVGGLDEYLFKLDENNLKNSIKDLESLLKLSAGSINVKGANLEHVYLSQYIEKDTTKEAEHKSTTKDVTKKFSVLTIPDDSNEEAVANAPFYKPADIEKSLSIIWVPDYTREYELVIEPSMFASSDISLTLADGWRLEAITANTGENQLIKEISSLLGTVIGAQKEIDLAKIGKEEAIKLKELELAEEETSKKAFGIGAEKELIVKIVGYIKKSEIKTIEPGLYDLTTLLSNETSGKINFTTVQTTLWHRLKL